MLRPVGEVQQTPVSQRQDLFCRQRIAAVFTERLLRRKAFRHSLITMDDNRKQAALALQPDLIEIVLDLAANAQIVNQDMAILRQSLLVQADMAVRIDVNDREDMIALGDKLSCQRAGTVRQIQQDPARSTCSAPFPSGSAAPA